MNTKVIKNDHARLKFSIYTESDDTLNMPYYVQDIMKNIEQKTPLKKYRVISIDENDFLIKMIN